MNIVAPISSIPEIQPLAAAGANELYCGVLTRQWVGTFKAASLNRRPTGNLSSMEDLGLAVDTAHANGCTLSLVLNAQQYSASQAGAATEVASSFLAMGGDALIVSDLGLIQALAAAVPAARIHVSSVATCRNESATRFYESLGAARVILPRDVTIEESLEIAAAVPGVEIETFILNDGCVFEEGACHTIHLPGKLGGPICLDKYEYRYRRRDGRALAAPTIARLAENDREYGKWLWYRFSCGFSTAPNGMPFGPCGLCAIPAFFAGGVRAVKIAGREGTTERKVMSVRMVRRIVDAVANGLADEAVREMARGLRPASGHCDAGYMCYYPEVARGADRPRQLAPSARRHPLP